MNTKSKNEIKDMLAESSKVLQARNDPERAIEDVFWGIFSEAYPPAIWDEALAETGLDAAKQAKIGEHGTDLNVERTDMDYSLTPDLLPASWMADDWTESERDAAIAFCWKINDATASAVYGDPNYDPFREAVDEWLDAEYSE